MGGNMPQRLDDLYPKGCFLSFPIGPCGIESKALQEYLDSVRNFAYSSTLKQIEWYNKSKNSFKLRVKFLRGLAIVSVSFGGLTPSLGTEKNFVNKSECDR